MRLSKAHRAVHRGGIEAVRAVLRSGSSCIWGEAMRMYGKVDANQAEIVKALRQVGMSVLSLAPMGKGCPDLLVADDDSYFLIEVQMLSKRHSMNL